MFASLQALFRSLTSGGGHSHEFDELDHRVATAALAVHAISLDGVVSEREKHRLERVLDAHFGLSARQTRELIEEAQRRDLEATDLYAFTSVLKRALDSDGRRQVVELLWQVVYADGNLHELEDNFVWRVAELLDVPSRDRMRLRSEVRRKRGNEPGAGPAI